MKPHHAILLGFAIGLVLESLAVIYFRKPCPPTATSTTTHHLLRTMSSDEWNSALTMFEAEEEGERETASDYGFDELLACSLSLLDEANKCGTLYGTDNRYADGLAKVQAHAGDCVRIMRELQTEN